VATLLLAHMLDDTSIKFTRRSIIHPMRVFAFVSRYLRANTTPTLTANRYGAFANTPRTGAFILPPDAAFRRATKAAAFAADAITRGNYQRSHHRIFPHSV